MNYTPYRSNPRPISADDMLDATEYAVAVAGVTGVNTTAADVTLCAGQTARLIFTPYNVKKPMNETAKVIVSAAGIALGAATGNKRAASAFSLIGKVAADILIRE